MSTLLYNGLRVFADEQGAFRTERSLDGGFHFFHVCCGCHKVHEAHFFVKRDGEMLVSEWVLPLPAESAKIIEGLPPALEKDLIVFERANFNAAQEIERLKEQRMSYDALQLINMVIVTPWPVSKDRLDELQMVAMNAGHVPMSDRPAPGTDNFTRCERCVRGCHGPEARANTGWFRSCLTCWCPQCRKKD